MEEAALLADEAMKADKVSGLTDMSGRTLEDALENAADLYDAIFEVNLMRSVTGIAADLQWTRSEQDNFIAEQVKAWFSVHRPRVLQDCEVVLRRR